MIPCDHKGYIIQLEDIKVTQSKPKTTEFTEIKSNNTPTATNYKNILTFFGEISDKTNHFKMLIIVIIQQYNHIYVKKLSGLFNFLNIKKKSK